MFGKDWKISESKYKCIVERNVKISMRDGCGLNADIFRPEGDERFPRSPMHAGQFTPCACLVDRCSNPRRPHRMMRRRVS